jgi:hypothetical protein
MKRWLFKFGFTLGFFATVALISHTVHDHSQHPNGSSHTCVLCDSPSVEASVLKVSVLPQIFSAPLSAEISPFHTGWDVWATGSPRSPPAL